MILFKNSKFKRLLSISICFGIMLSIISSTISQDVVLADSNNLRQTYLDLQSGKNLNDVTSIENMTTNDLRAIALYLSNFYVPYFTSLDGEVEESNKKAMVDALKNIGYAKDAAETLVNMVYQASLSSAQPLYVDTKHLRVNDEKPVGFYGRSTLNKIENASIFVATGLLKAKETGFITLTKDQFDKDVGNTEAYSKYHTAVGEDIVKGEDEKYTPVTLFIWLALFSDYNINVNGAISFSSPIIPMFSSFGNELGQVCFEINNSSRIFYNFIYSMLKATSSLGNAVLSTDLTSFVSDNVDEIMDQDSVFFGTQNLYVDWVGNIICDFCDRRVVVYPACMNPIALSTIVDDKEQGDVEKSSDLQRYFNISSTWGFLIKKGQSGKQVTFRESTNSNYYKFPVYKNEHNLYMSRGDKTILSFDTNHKWFTTNPAGDGGELRKIIGSYGFNTSNANNNKTGEHVGIHIYSTVTDDNYEDEEGNIYHEKYFSQIEERFILSDMLKFASIKSKNLETLNNNESSFYKYNAFLENNYLSNNSNFFNTSGNKLDKFVQASASDRNFLQDLMITYAFAYANKDSTTYDESYNYINMKFNDVFPQVDSSNIEFDIVDTSYEKIMSFVYYLLHPTEGISYVATLLKNKITGFFINWHEGMVGSSDSNYTTGMTSYLGTSSYVTVPSLYDVEWLAFMLDSYNSIIVYFIIIICVVLLCYVLVGNMTLQRGIIGVIIFSFLAFLPPVAINSTVNAVNTVNESIFNSKFDYWAYCQIQGYIVKLGEIDDADSVYDYIGHMMELEASNGEGGSPATSFSGVKLKWMSPKKMNDMAEVENELSNSVLGDTYSNGFINQMVNVLASTNSSETFVDNALYLYRDILDIYRYGAVTYNLYSEFSFSGSLTNNPHKEHFSLDQTAHNIITENWLSGHTAASGTFGVGSGCVVNTIKDANVSELKYSSGSLLQEYVLANNEVQSYVRLSDTIKDTSSLNAIRRGFLYNVFTTDMNSTTVDENKNVYADFNTMATTLFLGYNSEYMRTVKNYRKLSEALFGNGGIDLNKNTLLNVSVDNSPVFFGLSQGDFEVSVNDVIGYESGESIGHQQGQMRPEDAYKKLSGLYYGLYSESPFYFFNNNIRDQIQSTGTYSFRYDNLGHADGSIKNLLLGQNQGYFFNLMDGAADGYGELRDFMNFHDLFYYIIPCLKVGNDVVDLFDANFGMFTYEDCSLKISSSGQITYSGITGSTLAEILNSMNTIGLNGKDTDITLFEAMTDEQIYKLWHDYNVWIIFNEYTPWLDTMYDCDYAKAETISILGEKFTVYDPLDPTSYYRVDSNGEMIEGRYMIFSRSEMKYYGLDIADLTEVERKIITIQDHIYEKALDLMNYYTFYDETLIQAYALMQLFEFNKEFSQTSMIKDDYVLYPQAYELKAFTYDAYMRLILAEAANEPLQTSGTNSSIYMRVAKKTSILFGILLIINDILAVYAIPGLKLFFIIIIFLLSIALILAATVKMELNIVNTVWKSLLAPLGSFAVTSIGMAWIVSLFMSNGASGVVKRSRTISLGDPSATTIVMIIINVAVLILYFKICRKCFKDLKTYSQAIVAGVAGTVAGAFGKMTGAITKMGNKKDDGSHVPASAKQRGKDNDPKSGKNGLGLGGALAAGAAGGLASDMLSKTAKSKIDKANSREDAMRHMNKYDKKAFLKANDKADKFEEKSGARKRKLELAEKNGASDRKIARLQKAYDKSNNKFQTAQDKSKSIEQFGKRGARKRGYASDETLHRLQRGGTAHTRGEMKAKSFIAKQDAQHAKAVVKKANMIKKAEAKQANKDYLAQETKGIGRVHKSLYKANYNLGKARAHASNIGNSSVQMAKKSVQTAKNVANDVKDATVEGARATGRFIKNTPKYARQIPTAAKNTAVKAKNATVNEARTLRNIKNTARVTGFTSTIKDKKAQLV